MNTYICKQYISSTYVYINSCARDNHAVLDEREQAIAHKLKNKLIVYVL